MPSPLSTYMYNGNNAYNGNSHKHELMYQRTEITDCGCSCLWVDLIKFMAYNLVFTVLKKQQPKAPKNAPIFD